MPLINQKRSEKRAAIRGSASHSMSAKNEKDLMNRIGGKVTPLSGAGTKKADGYVKGLVRIESKGTRNKSYSVTRDLIQKTDEAALGAGEYPCIVIQFLDQKGGVEDEMAMMRFADVAELINRIQVLEAQCQS